MRTYYKTLKLKILDKGYKDEIERKGGTKVEHLEVSESERKERKEGGLKEGKES